MLSRVLPSARELSMMMMGVLVTLLILNLIRPAEAGVVESGPSTDVLFVATGENFPDALGAAAAAGALLAPVLLVQQNSVPAETAAELQRLSPEEIIIVGGTAVISDGVKGTLEGLPFEPTVTRIAGGNRYATAAALSEAMFPTTGLYPIALHASGNQSEQITSTGEVVRALPTFTAPVDGTLIVNSAANAIETTADEAVRCSITDGTSLDTTHVQAFEAAGTGGDFGSVGGTRGFDLTAGESITIRLVCTTTDAAWSAVSDSALTAIFVADI